MTIKDHIKPANFLHVVQAVNRLSKLDTAWKRFQCLLKAVQMYMVGCRDLTFWRDGEFVHEETHSLAVSVSPWQWWWLRQLSLFSSLSFWPLRPFGAFLSPAVAMKVVATCMACHWTGSQNSVSLLPLCYSIRACTGATSAGSMLWSSLDTSLPKNLTLSLNVSHFFGTRSIVVRLSWHALHGLKKTYWELVYHQGQADICHLATPINTIPPFHPSLKFTLI